MNLFESVYSQLKFTRYFDAVRVIDPSDNSLWGEKRCTDLSIQFPSFDKKETARYYEICKSSDRPVVNLLHMNENIFLIMIVIVRISGKNMLGEFFAKCTERIFLESINLNDQMGLLRQLHRLRMETITDELTGLFNRRYIDEKLPAEIKFSIKHKQPLSVIFSDLDYYKRVNDTYGHAAGDYILREFSRILSRNIQKDRDWIARYGGEEFLIFLSGAEAGKAKEIAERIRGAVMNKTFRFRNNQINLTCSFGVLTVDDFTVVPTVDQILDRVDKRLYQAKQSGRNIVVP